MLEKLSRSFVRSKDTFFMLNPNPYGLFKLPWIRFVLVGRKLIKETINVKNSKDLADAIGISIGRSILSALFLNRYRNLHSIAHRCSSNYIPRLNYQGLGATRRSWIDSRDKGLDGRIVKDLVMIYHDASIKHVDVHLGHLSMVYRVTGKPVEAMIKYNNKGMLTESSKEALLNHVRAEIKMNARVPWNHDHTKANARAQWAYDPTIKARVSYGSGPTRQIILEDKVEFYHPDVTSSLHMYAPKINPDQGLYIYQIYPGTDKTAPILIWGNLIPRDSKFHDRLHLTMIQEKDYGRFLERSDIRSITRKYDGASCYFSGSGDISKAHSFKFFSPRFSKVTGHRIEYTYKLPEMADKGTAHEAQGMGELLFWKRTLFGNIIAAFGISRGPECLAWSYLSASETGGILNSNRVRPRDVYPELRVYRMDKWNGVDVHDLPFFENRKLQEHLLNDCPCPNWKIVKLVKPGINKNWEGLVAVPEGKSVNDGLKIKWWADANDWAVTKVDLKIGPKGNIAGIVWFKSLESGKEFKLGPSNLGGVDRQLQFMDDPEGMIGKVFKVHGRNGHEGRAAKIVDEHLDKEVL